MKRVIDTTSIKNSFQHLFAVLCALAPLRLNSEKQIFTAKTPRRKGALRVLDIAFLHPKSSHGTLIELCEKKF